MGIQRILSTGGQETRVAAACVAIALAVYLAHVLFSPTDPLDSSINGDARKYWAVAGLLVDENRYGETRYFFASEESIELRSWRPPLTSFFLATMRYLGLDTDQVRLVYWLLIALTCMLLWASMRLLTVSVSPVAAAVATAVAPILYLIHPQTVRASLTLAAEVPFIFLLTLTLFLVIKASHASSHSTTRWQLAALAGIVCGLGLLSRDIIVVLLPSLLLLLIVRTYRVEPGRGVATVALTFIAGFVVVAGAWQLRNNHIHDAFVFVSSSGGYNLYKSNVREWSPESSVKVLKRASDALRYNSEADASRILAREALDHIGNNPGQFAKQAATRVVRTWGPNAGLYAFSPGWWWMLILHGLLAGCLIKVLMEKDRRAEWLALASIPVMLTLMHSIVGAAPRFAMPVMLPCYLITAYVLATYVNSSYRQPRH